LQRKGRLHERWHFTKSEAEEDRSHEHLSVAQQ